MQKQWSYWESQLLKQNADLIVVGAGFTGLSTAMHYKKLHPAVKVMVLERSLISEGASSKNAGFACYGSLGEIRADIELMGLQRSLQLVQDRLEGLNFLKSIVPESAMDYQNLGGTEWFLEEESAEFLAAKAIQSEVNGFFQKQGLHSELFQLIENAPKGFIGGFHSPIEAQVNPVKALMVLQKACRQMGVNILEGCNVKGIEEKSTWELETNYGVFKAQRIVFCSNAFGVPGMKLDLKPARNQVLISKPFEHNLKPGNYHVSEGYIYFRTVGDRILIGGARHLDLDGETTNQLAERPLILDYLRSFLTKKLGFGTSWEEDQNWSGIIATGTGKEPLLQELEKGLWYCGRFGGMGVALGAITGKRMAEVLDAN